MKKFLIVFFFVACIVPVASFAQTTGENVWTIDNFHADLTVNEDATLRVVETIRGRFNEERRGILRTLPQTYALDDRRELTVAVSPISVTDLRGRSVPYLVEEGLYDKTIRIGDANRFFTGAYGYRITYDVTAPFEYFDDRDELYWNVTGTEWEVPISSSSVTLHLPRGAEIVAVRCYTGYFGSTSEECEIEEAEDGMTVSASGYLTIAAGFTPEIIDVLEPNVIDYGSIADVYVRHEREERRVAFFSILGAFLVVGLYRLLLIAIFHDKKRYRGPIVAQFDPPARLHPAELGVFMDGKLNRRDMTAIIISWAARGFVKMEETGKRADGYFKIHKLKDFDATVNPWEKELFYYVFLGTPTCTMASIGMTLGVWMKRIEEKILKDLHELGLLHRRPALERKAMKTIQTLSMIAIVVLGWYCAMYFDQSEPFFASVGCASLIWAVTRFRPARSAKGSQVFGEVKGFRRFLKTAERYRLAWSEKEHIFEDLLPYAIVLGEVNHWENAFEHYIKTLPDTTVSSKLFTGAGGAIAFSTLHQGIKTLSRSMQSSVSYGTATRSVSSWKPSYSSPYKAPYRSSYRSSSSSSSRPSSSGSNYSSGGGSSGGGYGGGGGGSW